MQQDQQPPSGPCALCLQPFRAPEPYTAPEIGPHCREQSPLRPDLCLGCWKASHELELWLIRASDRTIIGDWSFGWLREILKDPHYHHVHNRLDRRSHRNIGVDQIQHNTDNDEKQNEI